MAAIDGMKESVQNQTEVALRLTRQVLLNHAAGSNAVFSPLSLHVLLSMVAAGTAGRERERLLSFLKATSAADLHAFASKVDAALFVNHPNDISSPRLAAANRVTATDLLAFPPEDEATIFVDHFTEAMPPRLTAANGVWIDKSLSFKPAFKAVLDGAYRAAANEVDFGNKVNFSYTQY